jgi:signal transduction histidine kinase
VEDYHSGRIFVKESAPGKGTTFRILVKSKGFDE